MIKFIFTLLICLLSVHNSYAQCSFTISKQTIQPTCGCNGIFNVSISPMPTSGVWFHQYLDDVFIMKTINQPNFSSLCPGTYKVVIVDNATGCKDSVTQILLPATNSFAITSKMDSATCETRKDGKLTLLLSNATMPVTYLWSHTTVEKDSIADSLLVGSYSVTVTDALGCKAILIDQKVKALSNKLKLKDSIITMGACGNDTGKILLTVSGGYPPIRFKWLYTDSFSMPLKNLPPGKYTCVFWDTVRCTDLTIKDVEIKLPPKPVGKLIGTDTICPLVGFGFLRVQILTGDSNTMTYSWSNDLALNNKFQDGLSAGNYKVTITDKVGCIDTPKATIASYPERILTFTGKTPIVKNETTIISINDTLGLSNIKWEATSTSKPANNGILVFPTLSQSYKVEATYGPQCIVKAQYYIEVIDDIDNLIIPNCFTPNGDGKNDTYKLIGEDNTILNFEIRIYDRWGNNVFSAYEPTFVWNGTDNKGAIISSGVYSYMVKYQTTHSRFESIVKKGDLLITK